MNLPLTMGCCAAALAMASTSLQAAEDLPLPVGDECWQGATQEVPGTEDQPAMVHWSFTDMAGILCDSVPRNWSGYHALAFSLTCDRPTANRLSIIVSSEDQERQGPDYYLATIPLDDVGPRHVVIPFEEMGAVRTPVGWDHVDSLRFHNNWSRDPDVAPQNITFSNLRLLRIPPQGVNGPRMTDEQFFGMLDLERRELAEVRKAWQQRDTDAAKQALARHMRTRRTPSWTVSPEHRPTKGMKPVSKRASDERGGRFRTVVPLDWTGWRKVVIPRDMFRAQAQPVGWHWVSGLSLNWQVHGDPYDGRQLLIDSVALVSPAERHNLGDFETAAVGWSGLYRTEESPQAGSASGKWWFPALYPVASCGRFHADWSEVDHLEFWLHNSRPGDRLAITVQSDYPDTARADKILTHTFAIGSFPDHPYDFGERIDWSVNAMDEGESRTIEWNAQLNRHFHFKHLYRAYWQTGDTKYAAELADQMNAWIEDNPVLMFRSGNSPYHHAWETLNTAIRLQNTWPESLSRCIDSPAFTDDIIVNVMKSIAEQVRHLQRHPTRGNWFTAESLGIYTCGVLFPEFRQAADWRREGVQRLYSQLDEEVYPDGMEYEVALGYNNWVLREYIQVLQLARLNGLIDEVPADYKDRIEKMIDYLMKDCRPDGRGFGLNDAGDADLQKQLVDGYDMFPKRSDFVYPVTHGQVGRHPGQDSFALPYTGHYIMRSGWKQNDAVLLMDAGRFGAGHQHEDKLSLLLYAHKRPLLVEGGVVMYDRSRWRAYVLLTRAHNTVLIDGMDQFRRQSRNLYVWPKPWDQPVPPEQTTRWHSTPDLDWCEGHYRGNYREYRDYTPVDEPPEILESVTHRRGVLFVKPDIWIVHDTFAADDQEEHTSETLFHINAEQAIVDDDGLVRATSEREAGLLLKALGPAQTPCRIVEGEREPPIQGWARQYGNPVKDAPMRSVPTVIGTTTWNSRAESVWVLHPLAPDRQTRISSQQSDVTEGEGIARQFTIHDRGALTYIANATPGKSVACSTARTDGVVGILCEEPGKALRLGVIDGTMIAGQHAELRLAAVASASVTGLDEGTFLVSADRATSLQIALPARPASATVKAFVLAPDYRRLDEQKIAVRGEYIQLNVAGGVRYELTWTDSSAKNLLHDETTAPSPLENVPVKALPELQTTTNATVVVQAENLTAQGGGKVEITDDKTDVDGQAFLHWDQPGHYVEYAVNVPEDGTYNLTVRYCTADDAVVRAVLIDGAIPDESLKTVFFDWTGGWSNAVSDWRRYTLPDKNGKPFSFGLTKGEHRIRFVNVRGSMNLDWIAVHSPDSDPMPPDQGIEP